MKSSLELLDEISSILLTIKINQLQLQYSQKLRALAHEYKKYTRQSSGALNDIKSIEYP